MIKYSLIIPTYNRMYITTSIVYNFLHLLYDRKDFEIIVVNDGSTDFTDNLIKNIHNVNSNVRLVNTNKMNGQYRNPGFARNTGLKFAKGEFVCFCDGDIFHLINPLIEMDKIVQSHSSNSFYVTGTYLRGNSNGTVSGPHGLGKNMPHGSWLATSKEVLLKIGGYDERYKIYGNEDHDIVQRLDRKGLKHISVANIIGVHPFFDSGRGTVQQSETLKKIQMELQRELSVVRNIGKEWGVGEEVIYKNSFDSKNSVSNLESNFFEPNKSSSLLSDLHLYNSIENINYNLDFIVEDRIKLNKILNFCMNLNMSLVAHREGIFKPKVQVGDYPYGREVFKFVSNDRTTVYSDLPELEGNIKSLEEKVLNIDLLVLSQIHRQRNVGLYLDKAFQALKVGGELVVICPVFSNCIGSGNTNNMWNVGNLVYNLILAGFDCKAAKISTFTTSIQLYLVKNSRKVPNDISLSSLSDFFPIEVYQHFNGNVLEVNWS